MELSGDLHQCSPSRSEKCKAKKKKKKKEGKILCRIGQ